jgi:hypothetical protein
MTIPVLQHEPLRMYQIISMEFLVPVVASSTIPNKRGTNIHNKNCSGKLLKALSEEPNNGPHIEHQEERGTNESKNTSHILVDYPSNISQKKEILKIKNPTLATPCNQ